MPSQLIQRLRTQQHWLRRMAALKASPFEDASTSWLRAAGVLGVASAGVYALSESTTRGERQSKEALDSPRTIATTARTTATAAVTPRIDIPSFWPLPPVINYCDCESKSGNKFSIFGRVSHLRRSQTIIQYKNEVSKESLRTLYEVNWKKPLGQGGFGAVYSAKDRRTGEIVALKQISKKYTDNVGFQREMEAFLHLRRSGGHPHICGLRENFDEGNYFYFSLDLISGGELFDHLIRSGPYSEEDASRLIREVASALCFMHGIGFVHGDLKPENLMLSTENTSDAVIKLIDFGCAQVTKYPDEEPGVVGLTAAYASPEMLSLPPDKRKRIDPPLDMWGLGVILHIMLVGCHPFDTAGDASDTQIAKLVTSKQTPASLQSDSPMTAHLSPSAMDLIRRLLAWDPEERITASEMLQHPWVTGETARKDKISGSDEKLKSFRVFKSRLEAKVFEDIISWAESAETDDVSKRTSLIERSFRKLDEEQKGFITAKDLKKLTGSSASPDDSGTENASLSLSAFSNLLAENLKDQYFPKGRVLYKEGEIGNSMLFINSGKLEVNTKDGYKVEVHAGNFVGEGALISPERTRNATIKCLTPVHAIEISREHFEKYLAASENRLALHMREKDKKRALNRTKNILRRQRELKPVELRQGAYIFQEGEEADEMFIVEEGLVDNFLGNHKIATSKTGEMFGVGSLVTHRKRNSSAVCATKSCRVQKMKAADFFEFINSSPILKASVYDVFLRKEFAKAVAHKTKKKFPMSKKELREVFDSIDTHGDGFLTLDELRELVLGMDKGSPEELVIGILNSLDIDSSGKIDFGEFCQIFLSKEDKNRGRS